MERRVFICRYWYFDPISEIAQRFGFSQSKVKMMLHRQRKNLLNRLERVEWEPSGGPDIPGGGVAIPGGHPEGADPIIESMAVYPATEDVRDVEDATIENIDESTAYGIPGLGNHLPTDLPDGYHFGKASLYETTIKNGTKYHLLRVTYTTSNDEIATAPDNDDGGVGVPAPNLFGSSFAVLIMDYEPRTNKPIYSFEDLREYLL